MANYRLVSNATFRPFSFEEYVKPYLMYGEAYKEMEMNVADLEEKAGKWDKLANEQTDPKTHATYKAYANELRALADLLSRYGMSPQLRRRAASMRGRYARDIEPIEAQYNKRELLRLEQHQMLIAANGSLRFDNDYNNMSLDTMIDNPNMNYDFVSGEKIALDVAAMVLAAANDVDPELTVDDVTGSPTNKEGSAFFLLSKKRRGYTLEQVEKALRGDEDADSYLVSIKNRVIDSYKDRPAFDEKWAEPYIAKGMMTGVLGVDSNMMANPNAPSDLELRKQSFSEWQGKQNVAQGWAGITIQRKNANTNEYSAVTSRMATLNSIRLANKEDARKDAEMEAIGKVYDSKQNKYREMTAFEKSQSTAYINANDREGARKALGLNETMGYLSVAANQKGRKLAKSGSPIIKSRTREQVLQLINSGAGVYTYNEVGSSSGSGSLAPHAKREIAAQLKRLGDVYKPEHFVYVVPKHKQGEAAEAILIAVDLLPELEFSKKSNK